MRQGIGAVWIRPRMGRLSLRLTGVKLHPQILWVLYGRRLILASPSHNR